MNALLFGVGPHDPSTFIAVPLLAVTVCLAAAYIPGERAARIDPATAIDRAPC